MEHDWILSLPPVLNVFNYEHVLYFIVNVVSVNTAHCVYSTVHGILMSFGGWGGWGGGEGFFVSTFNRIVNNKYDMNRIGLLYSFIYMS